MENNLQSQEETIWMTNYAIYILINARMSGYAISINKCTTHFYEIDEWSAQVILGSYFILYINDNAQFLGLRWNGKVEARATTNKFMEVLIYKKKETIYLGYVVSKEGMKIAQEKIKVIVVWKTPRTIKEKRRFQGLVSIYIYTVGVLLGGVLSRIFVIFHPPTRTHHLYYLPCDVCALTSLHWLHTTTSPTPHR